MNDTKFWQAKPVDSRREEKGDSRFAPDSNHERRFVKVERGLESRYAMGLLGLASDLDGLDLDSP